MWIFASSFGQDEMTVQYVNLHCYTFNSFWVFLYLFFAEVYTFSSECCRT